MSDILQAGRNWVALPLGQLQGTRLLSISLGQDQAWAVDDEGGVHMMLGSLLPPPSHAAPAWIPVEHGQGEITEGAQLVQVICSGQVIKVWTSLLAVLVWHHILLSVSST